MGTKLLSDLEVDEPLVQDAGYRFDDADRQLIDEQIRASQQALVDCVIKGVHATFIRVSGSSETLRVGMAVCLASETDASEPIVTKALEVALEDAKSVFGIVLRAAAPGSYALIAIGGSLSPSVTGLTSGAPGFVRVDTETALLERVGGLSDGDYGLGTVDNAGWMQVLSGLVTSSGGGGSPAGSDREIQYNDEGGFGASSDAKVDGDGYLRAVGHFRLQKTGYPSIYVGLNASALSAARVWAFPDFDDTIVGRTGTQTLTNKTVNVNDNVLTSDSSASGDILVHNGTKYVRLAKGTDGQVLKMVSGSVTWSTDATGGGGGSSDGLEGAVQLSDGAGGFVGASTMYEVDGEPLWTWTRTRWFAGGNTQVYNHIGEALVPPDTDTTLLTFATSDDKTYGIEVLATWANGVTVKVSAVWKRSGSLSRSDFDQIAYTGLADAPIDAMIFTDDDGTDLKVIAYSNEPPIDGDDVYVHYEIRIAVLEAP